MRKKTHIASGLAVASMLFTVTRDPSVAVAVFGAIIPDLDLRFRHRMLLHNIFAAALIGVALGAYMGTPTTSVWYVLGHVLHIALDSLTVSGVAVFYPLSRKRYGLRVCRTGGLLDSVLGVFFTLLTVLAPVCMALNLR